MLYFIYGGKKMSNNEGYLINYKDDLNAVLIKWKEISFGHDYRNIFSDAKEMLNNKNYSKLILDLTEGFDNELEDTEWVYKEFINSMKESSVHGVYLLINKGNSLKNEVTKEHTKWAKHFNVLTCYELSEVK